MQVMVWFAAAGAVILIELYSGTVYLLAVALAAALAGATAWFGGTLTSQFAVAAIGGSIGLYVAHGVRRRLAKHKRPPVSGEVGQLVTVVRPGTNPRVSWRGTEWDAVLADGSAAAAEDRLKIARQEGNRLVLSRE